MPARPIIDTAIARELAVKAKVDPRTIEKVVRGERVRGMAGHRARATLEAAGFVLPAIAAQSEPERP